MLPCHPASPRSFAWSFLTISLVVLGTLGWRPTHAMAATTFTNINAGLTGLTDSAAAWGDYDSDGDLDLVVSGTSGSGKAARIYRNSGGSFTQLDTSMTGVEDSDGVWGDYDGDGDLDLVVAAYTGSTRVTTLYKNSAGVFTDSVAGLTGISQGDTVWGDYDNDGDLDLLAAGAEMNASSARLYRNDGATLNSVPAAPTGLSASVSDSSATLSWAAASDSATASASLTYNLRIGTTIGGGEVLTAHANPASGWRRLAALGNVGHQRTWTIVGLTAGTTYYWSVQTIDSAFAGSAFASAGSFIPGQFTLTVARAGLGSGAVTSSPSGISCGADCSETYLSGTVVTLTATPASGTTFGGWGGGCAGTIGTSCQITISAASTVTATFGSFKLFLPLITR